MRGKKLLTAGPSAMKRFWKGSESHNIYAHKEALFSRTRVLDVSPLSARVFAPEKADVRRSEPPRPRSGED